MGLLQLKIALGDLFLERTSQSSASNSSRTVPIRDDVKSSTELIKRIALLPKPIPQTKIVLGFNSQK
jgi:hypothetical protein